MVVKVKQEVARSTDLQRAKLNGLRLDDVLDRQMLASGDDVLHLVEPRAVEHRLHPIHYIIYMAFAEERDEQPREQTWQPASLPWLRDVALAAMFPLPDFRGDEEAVEEEDGLLLQLLKPTLPGYLVEREDIDVDALVHLDVAERGLREAGAIHADLHKEERRVRLRVGCLEEEAVTEFLLRHLGETLIVVPHHAHIDVVVPGQYLLPEVRADGRSARHEVADAMLPADAVHLSKRLIERSLQPLKLLLTVLHL